MSASRAKRLAVVLRIRRLAEDRAKTELGLAAGALARARAGRAAAGRRLRAEQDHLALLQQGRATGGDLSSAMLSLSIADELIEAAERAVTVAVAGVAAARTRLAEASRARDVVERLRNRTLDAERQEADRREIVDASEVAGVRHAWRVLEGEPA